MLTEGHLQTPHNRTSDRQRVSAGTTTVLLVQEKHRRRHVPRKRTHFTLNILLCTGAFSTGRFCRTEYSPEKHLLSTCTLRVSPRERARERVRANHVAKLVWLAEAYQILLLLRL